jgi:ubiquitin-like 1-activating enzyme E1 B
VPRQFLFRRQHVGKSKSLVARESVLQYNPSAKITAKQANIKDENFDTSFFEQFDCVFNALDNVGARRHVNRLCLASKRPLIESGTQGYLGQVVPILPNKTECFECQPQPAPKTYAVCTIRNTPELPVHCIVWGKHVFAALFGPPDESNMLSDMKLDIHSADDAVDENYQNEGKSAGDGKIGSKDLNDKSRFENRIFDLYFTEEIEKQCEVKERWQKRAPPTPLRREQLLKEYEEMIRSNSSDNKSSHGTSFSSSSSSSLNSSNSVGTGMKDQRVLSVCELTYTFLETVRRIVSERAQDIGEMSFDKDDDLTMDFVFAASNLRMHIFGIEMQSRFQSKGLYHTDCVNLHVYFITD